MLLFHYKLERLKKMRPRELHSLIEPEPICKMSLGKSAAYAEDAQVLAGGYLNVKHVHVTQSYQEPNEASL